METVHGLAEEITKRLVENTVRSQFRRANLATVAELADQELSEDRMVDDALGVAFGLDSGVFYDAETDHDHVEVLYVATKLDELVQSLKAQCENERQLLEVLKKHNLSTPEQVVHAIAHNTVSSTR